MEYFSDYLTILENNKLMCKSREQVRKLDPCDKDIEMTSYYIK